MGRKETKRERRLLADPLQVRAEEPMVVWLARLARSARAT
jgi:hypothetical protein